MKKFTLLVFWGLLLFISSNAQEINFTYKVDSINSNNVTKYIVTVKINMNEGPYSVSLFEDLFKKGMILLDKKDDIITNEVKLEFIGKKHCLIIVRNKYKQAIKSLKY